MPFTSSPFRWRLRRRVLLAFLAALAPLAVLAASPPAHADVCQTQVTHYPQEVWTPWYPCPGPQDQPVAAAGVVLMSNAVGECCLTPVQFWKIEQGTQAYFSNVNLYVHPSSPDGSVRRYIEKDNVIGAPVIADTGMVPLGSTVKFNGIESLKPGTYYVANERAFTYGTIEVTPCWTCQLTSDNTSA